MKLGSWVSDGARDIQWGEITKTPRALGQELKGRWLDVSPAEKSRTKAEESRRVNVRGAFESRVS